MSRSDATVAFSDGNVTVTPQAGHVFPTDYKNPTETRQEQAELVVVVVVVFKPIV